MDAACRPADLVAACSLFIGLAIVFYLLKRPKPNRPSTWAECMLGAVGVFALMTLAYAVIPHEWITFSDKYLQWDTTNFVVRSGQEMLFFEFPFDINQQAVRDIVATVIYVVFFGLNLALFVMWQKRGEVDRGRRRRSRANARASAARCGAARSRVTARRSTSSGGERNGGDG